MTEPANPFWQGYERSPQKTAELIAALSIALYTNPQQRLGQLLTNLARGRDLWDFYDEDWIFVLSEESCPACGSDDRSAVPYRFRTRGPFCDDPWHGA